MKPIVVLVLVYHRADGMWVFARYEGKVCTDRFVDIAPATKEWIEELRRDPTQFGHAPT